MNEQDIPIDIHVNKLSDWLVSRRIVDKNWQKNIKFVRNKINEAIKDMPGNAELISLLSGSCKYRICMIFGLFQKFFKKTSSWIFHNNKNFNFSPFLLDINYFHCEKIIEILKTTEKDSKNIFGSYASQRMKDWLEVMRIYEKEALYLAEAAQIASRNINYEIPSARKAITTLEKLSAESQTRSQDAIKSEQILHHEYVLGCQQLGIKGDNIKRELVDKLKDLPDLQQQVADIIPKLNKAVNLYENFSGSSQCLPILKHLIKAGNTTVFEYLHGEVPSVVVEPPLPFTVEEDTHEVEEAEIDFGDVEEDIDWGAGEEEIITEKPAGHAHGDEAFNLLDSPTHRDTFLDELFELEAFLKMRHYELQSNDKVHVIAMTLMDGFTDHDLKTVNEMLAVVDEVMVATNTSLHLQLHMIKHSPKHVDIITNKLRQKLRGIEKCKASQVTLREKSGELKQQASELKPNLVKMIEQTKVLLKNVSGMKGILQKSFNF